MYELSEGMTNGRIAAAGSIEELCDMRLVSELYLGGRAKAAATRPARPS